MVNGIVQFLKEFGFSSQDIALLIICPICSALGGFIHGVMQIYNTSEQPATEQLVSGKKFIILLDWLVIRVLVSAVLGFVIALYFVGALTTGPTVIARIMAVSILIGYAAPKVWTFQEKSVTERLERHLRTKNKDEEDNLS